MGYSDIPTPVFIETNLGTRLAAPVSPDITAKEFKRELEEMHLNCFPEFGSIKVNALMVKQKSHSYHLSESLPLKYAFLGSIATQFLQMDVNLRSTSDHVESLNCNDTELHNLSSIANVVTNSFELGGFTISTHEERSKCKRKKDKIQGFPYLKAPVLKRKRKRKNVKRREIGRPEQAPVEHPLIEKETSCQFSTRDEVNRIKKWDNNAIAEALSDTFSEPASVSRIIKKYFSDYDEVASSFTTVRSRRREWLNSSTECKYLNIQSPQVSQDVCLEKLSSEASREKCIKPQVGKRLLLASESFRLSPSNQRPILSLCRYSNGKSAFQKSTATVQNLVFESLR